MSMYSAGARVYRVCTLLGAAAPDPVLPSERGQGSHVSRGVVQTRNVKTDKPLCDAVNWSEVCLAWRLVAERFYWRIFIVASASALDARTIWPRSIVVGHISHCGHSRDDLRPQQG